MSWYESAKEHISRVHKTLPDDVSFDNRVKAIREAYPWGERRMHPYKMWLKAQRQYLARYEPDSESKRFPLSPLERMMRKAKEKTATE